MRIKCPNCGAATQIRTSNSLSENTTDRYHQCINVACSCTFKSQTTIIGYIHKPLDKSTLKDEDKEFLSDPKNATKKIHIPKTTEVGVSGKGRSV
jgi:hypothetical protein